jgi:glycosyltransferase involved in cell wall biosynthesis
VSEAFAFGVPVVMSGLTAESFGLKDQDNIGCIGSNIDSFKECILRLYNNERDWNEARENAMEFIRTTHNRNGVLQKWTNVMDKALATAHSRRAEFESSSLAGKEDIHLMHNLFKLKVPKF